MIIPTFQDVKFVETTGFLTSAMRLYNDELNNVLRNGLSDNGWTLPEVTTVQLTAIMNLPADQQMPNGTIWYVSDKPPLTPYNELVVKMDDGTGTASTFYKLTKSAYP
jgi:hypothetical protein